MQTSELKKQNPGANLTLIISAVLFIGISFASRAAEANGYTPILHPTIFWHNNQWETYENGQWVPYRDPANKTVVEPEPEETVVLAEPRYTSCITFIIQNGTFEQNIEDRKPASASPMRELANQRSASASQILG